MKLTRRTKRVAVAALVIVAAAVVFMRVGARHSGLVHLQSNADGLVVICERVVDGDTIVLVGGERVRYIGIDTPETVHPSKPVEAYGKEASELNRELVEGKSVRIEFDVRERDRYGRLLGYVYVSDEGLGEETFVNAELVRRGLAHASTFPPDVKHAELFVRLEREARDAGRGLWADTGD